MKKHFNLVLLLLILGAGQSFGQTNPVTPKVYYFHSTARCITCQTVEKVTKEAVKEFYGDKVSFLSVNNDDKTNESLMKKYRVSGQTLLIVKGDKVVNLTNDAFMNARTKPEKLKAKIKSTVDSLWK